MKNLLLLVDETSTTARQKQTKIATDLKRFGQKKIFYLWASQRHMQSQRKIPVACTEINNTMCFHFFILLTSGHGFESLLSVPYFCAVFYLVCFGAWPIFFWQIYLNCDEISNVDDVFFGFIFLFVCLFECTQRVFLTRLFVLL